MNKNGGKRIKMSLYTVGTLFQKGRIIINDLTEMQIILIIKWAKILKNKYEVV